MALHKTGDLYSLLFQNKIVKEVSAIISTENPSSMFHYGCGDAYLLGALRDLGHTNLSYSGVDYRKEKINAAQKQFPNADFSVQSVESPFSPSSPFDMVITWQTLEFLERPDKVLQKLVGMCSGTLVIIAGNKRSYGTTGFLRKEDHMGFTADRSQLYAWKLRELVKMVEGYRIVSNFYTSYPCNIVTAWCGD